MRRYPDEVETIRSHRQMEPSYKACTCITLWLLRSNPSLGSPDQTSGRYPISYHVTCWKPIDRRALPVTYIEKFAYEKA